MGAYLTSPVCTKESEDGGEIGSLRFGASSMQGWRITQEDAHCCLTEFDLERKTSMFAVFDGHGGAEVAQYTASHLPTYVKSIQAYKDNKIALALEEAFLGFDATLVEPPIVRKLKELAGVTVEDEEIDDEAKEEAAMLCEEAEMPLETILERYGGAGAVGPTANKAVQALRKLDTKKYTSPALRAKPSSTSSSVSDVASSSDGAGDIPRMKLDEVDDTALVNGHATVSSTCTSDNINQDSEPVKDQASCIGTDDVSVPSKTVNDAGDAELKTNGDSCKVIKEDDATSKEDNVNEALAAKDVVVSGEECDLADKTAKQVVESSGNAGTDMSKERKSKRMSNLKLKLTALTMMKAKMEMQVAELEEQIEEMEENLEVLDTEITKLKKDIPVEDRADKESDQTTASVEFAEKIIKLEMEKTTEEKTMLSMKKRAAELKSKLLEMEERRVELRRKMTELKGKKAEKPDGQVDGSDESEEEEEEEKWSDDDSEEEDDDDGFDMDAEDGEEDADDLDEEDDDDDDDDEEDGCSRMMGSGEEPGTDSGCTAVVALLQDRELYVANAGDSRCVLCRDGKAVEMSFDHKPEDAIETARIRKAGGHITCDGRVNGGLNLSRAIGDHCYKQNKDVTDREQMITALPDVKHLTLDETDEFMVIACDGIWNVMSSEEVVEFVRARLRSGITKLSQICEEMFDRCISPDTSGDGTGCDNMTCVIVLFPVSGADAAGLTNSPAEIAPVQTNKRKALDEEVEENQVDSTAKRLKCSEDDNEAEAVAEK